MIGTVCRIQWQRLRNSPVELIMAAVVPLVFFSIFAAIFGSRERNGAGNKIKIAVCDLVRNDQAKQILDELKELEAIRIYSGPSPASQDQVVSLSLEQAIDAVRRGMVSVAVVIKNKKGSEGTADRINASAGSLECQLLADSSDQVAPQVVSALVQKSLIAAMPRQPDHAIQLAGGTLDNRSLPAHATNPIELLPSIQVRDVLGGRKSNPIIAMYAAGIAVMFLLFTASTSGGTLLEEKENGTLDRLLTSHMTLDELLMGKWLFLTIQGMLQVTLMFTWGAVVFGVELMKHWDGFLAMTLVTASAGSSLALLMAAACRSRSQMNWVSVVVILSMSALGGSMVPRYLMSERMQQMGWLTFNAWSLEGYQKVFWRDLPLVELGAELGILTACAVSFLVLARFLMGRWVQG